jgi:endoplasmic reticulum resident protein 44
MLAPIFDEAADKVAAEFPEPGQVVMGKVDCDKEGMNRHVEHQIIY